jgi:acetyl esterase/lipase
MLLAQARVFADRGRAAGVDVILDVLPDMPHDHVAAFVRTRLERA